MAGNRTDFAQSMDDLEAKVIKLFAMIAEDQDLPAATQALLGGGQEAVTALAERKQVIDALYVEVEQLSGREILLQAPVVSDLRFLLTVLRIVPELERSHDLVMDVAARAGRIRDTGLSAGSRELARKMAHLATGMWRQAVDAWYSRDRTAVTVMAERNTRMVELHASMTAEIAAGRAGAGHDGGDLGGTGLPCPPGS
ncbi:phosphate uptake regulator PhoU [Trebonia sp.]|uniref:phosphate signaling complex PhoU family protein n=1 Tax=Trebonia sp. TaxID=2767075 RepID=UPI0026189C46|nr:phosphate uptake regulator PhoU [Trebonia sp.]